MSVMSRSLGGTDRAAAAGNPPVADAPPANRILSEIASSLSSEGDVDELLRHFLSAIVRLAGASAGAARVLSDDGAQLLFIGSVGLPADVVRRELAIEHHCGP